MLAGRHRGSLEIPPVVQSQPNSRLHILIVSQFYAPDITAAAFRITETADLLREDGHDVRVITTFPHKSRVACDDEQDARNGVYRVPVAPVDGGGARRYLSQYFSFVRRSLWLGLKQRLGPWRPDVVWTSSPPIFTGITGYALARFYRCPLVFDVRDVWPQSAVSAGQIREGGRALKLGKQLEKALYNRADHITCVSQAMADYIATRTATPTTVIYNGVLSKYAAQSRPAEIRKRILYAGNLGRVQGLDVPIRAFAAAARQGLFNGWTLEFAGGGAVAAELTQLAAQLGMSARILFHPPMGKEQAMREMAQSALLLISLKADDVFELTIPSKVFDYLIVGRPILFGIRGEGRDILNATGGNVAFDPGDERSLFNALDLAWREFTTLEAKSAENPRAVIGKYLREHNCAKLIDVFKGVRATAK